MVEAYPLLISKYNEAFGLLEDLIDMTSDPSKFRPLASATGNGALLTKSSSMAAAATKTLPFKGPPPSPTSQKVVGKAPATPATAAKSHPTAVKSGNRPTAVKSQTKAKPPAAGIQQAKPAAATDSSCACGCQDAASPASASSCPGESEPANSSKVAGRAAGEGSSCKIGTAAAGTPAGRSTAA